MVSLQCISCAGKLEISQELDRFACGYCGTEQIVERKGGTISLKGVTDAISRVQAGTDKTAAELALGRLEQELQEVSKARGLIQARDNSAGALGCIVGITILVAILLLMAGNNGQASSAGFV